MSLPELLTPFDLDDELEHQADQPAQEVAAPTNVSGGNPVALEQSMAEITSLYGGAAEEEHHEVETEEAVAHEGAGDHAAAHAPELTPTPDQVQQAHSVVGEAPKAADPARPPAMDDAKRKRRLRGQHKGLLRLYRKGKLDEAQVIEKMIAYDRKLNGGEVSIEGVLMIPSLFTAMFELQAQRAQAQAKANAAVEKVGGGGGGGGAVVKQGGGGGGHDADEFADDATEASIVDAFGGHAGGGEQVKSEGGTPKTNATSGGGKKTSGPKDLVETYGTVDEIKRKDLTEDVKVYFVDGLQKKGKHKTTEEVDGVDSLPMTTKTTPVHKKVAPLFREIFEEIKANGDWRNILEHPWAYNPRQNRNNPTEWSVHSWGTAIDVNATTNPNDNSGASRRQKEISHYFTDRGFTWLEDTDAMHFQLHSGGAAKITDEEIEQVKDGKHSGTGAKELTRDIKKAVGKAEWKLAKENGKKKPSAKKVAKLEARLKRMNDMLVQLTGSPGTAVAQTKA